MTQKLLLRGWKKKPGRPSCVKYPPWESHPCSTKIRGLNIKSRHYVVYAIYPKAEMAFCLSVKMLKAGWKRTSLSSPDFKDMQNEPYSRVSNNRTASIKRTLWKTRFQMACKKGQFDVVELMANNQFKAFSINLNAQHVNGMTRFDLDVHFISSKI